VALPALVVTLTVDDLRSLVREAVETALRRSAPETMTIEQASAYCGRAPKTVRGWILQGLTATRTGRRVYVKRADLEEWLARGQPASDALVASLRRAG
jgi:excisionase family DNA binding protein